MIIGDISLKRVPELMGFHCIHCSQHSLKAPKTKLFYHSTDIVCRKSKPDPDAVLLWKCSSSDSSGLIVHHDFHGFCFVGSKAQCNHMRPLIFYPFGETFIVDKALLSVFVRQFTVKVKFSWTVSSDLCCWLWHLARNNFVWRAWCFDFCTIESCFDIKSSLECFGDWCAYQRTQQSNSTLAMRSCLAMSSSFIQASS